MSAILRYCHTLYDPINIFAYMVYRGWIRAKHIEMCKWWSDAWYRIYGEEAPVWLQMVANAQPGHYESAFAEARAQLTAELEEFANDNSNDVKTK